MKGETLAESVAAALQSAILQGEYLSGERLVELALAKQLNVSQNTVRDALRILEQNGWVVKHARRGVYVRKFTLDEAGEIFALLGAVEALALEWALETMTKAHLADLRRLVDDARRDAAEGNGLAAIETLFRFHLRLVESAQKLLTIQMMQQLYNQVRLLEAVRQARVPRNPHELNAHIRRHESLYFYIEAGDANGAHRLLREQLQMYGETVRAALALV